MELDGDYKELCGTAGKGLTPGRYGDMSHVVVPMWTKYGRLAASGGMTGSLSYRTTHHPHQMNKFATRDETSARQKVATNDEAAMRNGVHAKDHRGKRDITLVAVCDG